MIRMTEKEYRMHPAISRSELWKLSNSPEKFKYYKDHPQEPTPALLFGQAFHKLALQPRTFNKEFAIIPSIDKQTKEGKLVYQNFVNEAVGKTIITSDMYDLAKEMVKSLKKEPLAVKLLKGRKEVPFFWADELTGEECKCRLDVLNEKFSQPIIVDLKSANSAAPDEFMRSAIKHGYDFQSAMYSEGYYKNKGIKPLFVFIVVEKEPPFAVNIFQADELFIKRGYDIYREFIGIYHDCKTTDNWYGYLGKTGIINNLALPNWLAKEFE